MFFKKKTLEEVCKKYRVSVETFKEYVVDNSDMVEANAAEIHRSLSPYFQKKWDTLRPQQRINIQAEYIEKLKSEDKCK